MDHGFVSFLEIKSNVTENYDLLKSLSVTGNE